MGAIIPLHPGAFVGIGRANVFMPGSSQTTTNFVGHTALSTTTYSGGGNMELSCSVQIVTDPGNVIRAIKPMGDSIGMWNLSRCAEIFGARS